jgi:hypothetical protein
VAVDKHAVVQLPTRKVRVHPDQSRTSVKRARRREERDARTRKVRVHQRRTSVKGARRREEREAREAREVRVYWEPGGPAGGYCGLGRRARVQVHLFLFLR